MRYNRSAGTKFKHAIGSVLGKLLAEFCGMADGVGSPYTTSCTNGSKMNKTPVSMLQELMMKRKIIPNYDLTFDGGGTHDNTFVYQVSCDNLMAVGKGRCKKDAKHEAAKSMLEKIAALRAYPQLPASPAPSPIKKSMPTVVPVSPKRSPDVPFLNAIGALTTLCCENNLEPPEYEEVSDVGPPHARIFTMRCRLFTFTEEGIATTKKQAKHEAARKMLEKIQDVVEDIPKAALATLGDEETLNANNAAVEKYSALTKMPSRKVNLGIKMENYHVYLKMSLSESENLESFLGILHDLNDFLNKEGKDVTEAVVEDGKKRFIDLLKPLNMTYYSRILETWSKTKCLVLVQISTNPDVVEIGVADIEHQAEWDGIKKVLHVLLKLLL